MSEVINENDYIYVRFSTKEYEYINKLLARDVKNREKSISRYHKINNNENYGTRKAITINLEEKRRPTIITTTVTCT